MLLVSHDIIQCVHSSKWEMKWTDVEKEEERIGENIYKTLKTTQHRHRRH